MVYTPHTNAAWILLIIMGTIAVGMCGLIEIGHQPWPRAFMNAAMILSNVGMVDRVNSNGLAIFLGIYSLACGCVIYLIISILFHPLMIAWARRRPIFEVVE